MDQYAVLMSWMILFKQRVSMGQHRGVSAQPGGMSAQPRGVPVDQSEQARGLGSGQAAWAKEGTT